MAGVRWEAFELRKWMQFHIAVDDGPLTEALNREGAEFHYRNQTAWVGFVGLEWQACRRLALQASANVGGDAEWRLALEVAF